MLGDDALLWKALSRDHRGIRNQIYDGRSRMLNVQRSTPTRGLRSPTIYTHSFHQLGQKPHSVARSENLSVVAGSFLERYAVPEGLPPRLGRLPRS